MKTQFVVTPESESLLCGERKTSAEYVVANPLNIEVELKSGEVCRPQDIRERIVRCRDCVHAYEDGTLCAHFSIPNDNDMSIMPSNVEPDGFCSWGEPRDGNGVLEPPTERQLDFIESIQDVLGIEFGGSTKAEASEWIDEHFEEYKLESADWWALEHGYF